MYQDASASLREGYKAEAEDNLAHLRLGITAEGILHALEAMGFIYWDYMASNTEKQYTLRSTKYTLFNRTKGRWKYAPYNRSKYPNIAWVDEVVGPIETDDIYDFKNVVGYDIDECTRDWLRNNRSEGYESYEGLSICEVVLIDPRFSEIRHCVGIADVFISHMDSEPLLGEGSTTAQLFSFLSKNVESSFLWLDYTSLRACKSEFKAVTVIELVKEIGTVYALIDRNLGFMRRTWCVFELYAAIAGKASLTCSIDGNSRNDTERTLATNPVRAKEASTLKAEDKQKIDGFIRALSGGFKGFDRTVTKALAKDNTSVVNYVHSECCCLGQCLRLCLPWWVCISFRRCMYSTFDEECAAGCCCFEYEGWFSDIDYGNPFVMNGLIDGGDLYINTNST